MDLLLKEEKRRGGDRKEEAGQETGVEGRGEVEFYFEVQFPDLFNPTLTTECNYIQSNHTASDMNSYTLHNKVIISEYI